MNGLHRLARISLIVTVAAALVTGCGRAREAVETARDVGEAARFARDMQDGEATIKTEDGEAKIAVDKDGEQVTWKATDKEGRETTVTHGEDADLSDLGVAVYPGATQEMTTRTSGADGGGMSVILTTTDPFEKVAEFYKAQYPDAGAHEMSTPDGKMLMLNVSEKPEKMVTITSSSGEEQTGIAIITAGP